MVTSITAKATQQLSHIEEANHLVSAPVPANNNGSMVMNSEMIDLGLVIKAQAVLDVINAYLGKWAE